MRKVASVATSHAKKVVKLTISVVGLGPRFNSSKCKTAAKMAVARIKLLRNKREVVVRQMRRDIALLLQSGQDATARIRVEHVIREQNVLAANELLELFCELVVARLSIIAKQRGCPADLKEGISSLIFAAPRCSEIPELAALRNIFEKKYGRDFVSAATDLRPSCGVNRMLIDKLSVRTPSGEVKLKVMKEIAKEYQVDWDTTESEKELLKPPEELIEGPRTFVNAASLPVMPSPLKSVEKNIPTTKSRCEGGIGNMQFEDTASAAEAAAESAKQAIAAAQAAAYLANKDFNQVSEATKTSISTNPGVGMHSDNSIGVFMSNDQQIMDHEGFGSWVSNDCHLSHDETRPRHIGGEPFYRRHSCNEMKPIQTDGQNVTRRHSYNNAPSRADIKFDESDYDEEIEMEEPPSAVYPPPERSPPPVPSSRASLDPGPRVHPNLPDYDVLAARFEALKHRKP